ncbi:hypothetical protein G7Y79_00003g008980 [Physcia stellaris]|nr:hypothetical protein G7Y79_00003g008980 [Physcia stellaris]
MTTMVEARSLSTVLSIADDPPSNPRNGAGLLQDQLVLYIARVPDIFLTTMKPLKKVVTAPDVENCLYYIHLDSKEDEKLLGGLSPSIEHQPFDDTGKSFQSHQAETIKRKPLCTNIQLDIDDPPEHPMSSYGPLQGNVPSLGATIQTHRQHGELRGPRPMQSMLHTIDEPTMRPVLGKAAATQESFPRRWSEQPVSKAPELPPREGALNLSVDSRGHEVRSSRSTSSNEGAHTGSFLEDPSEDTLTNSDFTLTLIRRYNGTQSNVGKIVQHIGRSTNGHKSQDIKGRSLLKSFNGTTAVDIFTPGYMKFRSSGTEQNVDQFRETRQLQQPIPDYYSNHNDHTHQPLYTFRRQLHAVEKRPSQQSRPESNNSYLSTARLRSSNGMKGHKQQNSEGSEYGTLSPILPPDAVHSDARAFVFESPWHGSCEFSTGIAGRSLKCKHTLNSSSEALSELRFNLPSSNAFSPALRPPSSPDAARESKRSSIFSRHGRAHSASEYSDYRIQEGKIELEDRMDLSLGQERAGGGFGGKQAKLGKLIIEKEGLKMLDLIVAANLALWWKVYEKTA